MAVDPIIWEDPQKYEIWNVLNTIAEDVFPSGLATQATLLAFKDQNHSDLSAIYGIDFATDATLSAFSSENHSDLSKILAELASDNTYNSIKIETTAIYNRCTQLVALIQDSHFMVSNKVSSIVGETRVYSGANTAAAVAAMNADLPNVLGKYLLQFSKETIYSYASALGVIASVTSSVEIVCVFSIY